MQVHSRSRVESKSFRLRPGRPADLDLLTAIDQACFALGVAYSRAELAAYVGRPRTKTWVVEAENEIVGFVVAVRQGRQIAHIITIDVLEVWRSRGLGAKLMQAVEDWARRLGLTEIYLETADDNLTAQRFYHAHGYARVDTLKDYYACGLDAWLMLKRL